MIHPELIVAVLACVAGCAFATGQGGHGGRWGEPPRRETDTAWIKLFLTPEGSELAADAPANLAAYAASEAFGDAQMRGALELLLDRRKYWLASETIKHAGKRTEAMLLESLRDHRFPPRPDPEWPEEFHPWDFAAERLARLGARELVPFLLEEERAGRVPPKYRSRWARWIAAVGAPESIEPTLRALGDSDEYVRFGAMDSIGSAIWSGHLSPEMRSAMFAPVLDAARAPRSSHMHSRAQPLLLLRLDRRRAIAALMSDEMLSPRHPRLRDVLSAFTDPPPAHVLGPGERYDPIAVPPEKLWALWRHAEAEGLEPRKGSIASAVLLALAISDPEGTKPVAEALLAGGGWLAGSAVSALMRIENFPLGTQARELWNAKSAGTRAPLPILYVDAVEAVYFRQALGGLSHFLEVYEDWRLGPEGFRAIGLPECAEAVEWTAAFYFGPSGPPDDLEERDRILSDRDETEQEDRLLAAQGKTVEEAGPRAYELIFKYMRRHRAVFENLQPRNVPERP